MSERTLAELAPQIFERLEQRDLLGANQDHQRVIVDFFTEIEKTDEMAKGGLTPGYYYGLRNVVLRDVLPLYFKYAEQRDIITANQNKRKMWKYVAATVAIAEGLAALFTKGRSMTPQLAVPMIAVEAAIGAGIYGIVKSRDNAKLKVIKNSLNESVATLDQTLRVTEQYRMWKDMVGSNQLLEAEALEVISKYDSPREFWQDYIKVRSLDPITPIAKNRLQIPQFETFLTLHADGVYSDEARELRYNQLFIAAHREFTHKDPKNYALESLMLDIPQRASESVHKHQKHSPLSVSNSSRRRITE